MTKSIKKILTTIFAATLGAATLAIFASCAPAASDFTFEAENAIIDDDGAQSPVTVENTTEWTESGDEGVEVTNIGYFTTSGETLTFKIESTHECDATLTLRAASGVCDMETLDWTTFMFTMKEVDLSENEYITLKVNGTEASLSGVLPETENSSWYLPASYHHFGEGTADIHLTKGENIIIIEVVSEDGMGINIDKITINAASTLTWTETDNSDRASA